MQLKLVGDACLGHMCVLMPVGKRFLKAPKDDRDVQKNKLSIAGRANVLIDSMQCSWDWTCLCIAQLASKFRIYIYIYAYTYMYACMCEFRSVRRTIVRDVSLAFNRFVRVDLPCVLARSGAAMRNGVKCKRVKCNK